MRFIESKRNEENIAGMARFGITSEKVYGLGMKDMTSIARRAGRDHRLAQELWATGIYEARVISALVGEPSKLTREEMERWALEFDSWAICDGVCGHLFDHSPFVWEVIPDWCLREEEFVRRAGFALIAFRAVHDKESPDERFIALLPLIRGAATDDRPMVMKAVNWALRNVGKRDIPLNRAAIEEAVVVGRLPSKSARWIASDALRELRGEKVQERLRRRSSKVP